MEYILQINTGNTIKANYRANEIIKRLEHLSKYINISKVIFGWFKDYQENKKISEYLRNKNIKSYFWLPVFAEIIDLDIEDNYLESNLFEKKKSQLNEGDNFEFVCQSSKKNISYIKKYFEETIKDINIDGVFLDRIRYKSPALAKDSIFGCQCDNCKILFKAFNVDKNIYDKLTPKKMVNGIYYYEDNNINKLMKIKRDTITNQIRDLYDYFKNKNLKVGLDTFALCLADFVGQDLVKLNECSDFIKPMFYLKTTAPAGLPFELEGLPQNTKKAISDLWGCNLANIKGSIQQCKYLLDRKINIVPGIDVNYIKDICESDEDYVIEFLNMLKYIDCNEVVLSWDSMKIEDTLLEKIANID